MAELHSVELRQRTPAANDICVALRPLVPIEEGKELVERAQRFLLETPIRYWANEAGDWEEGKTVNISATGVLFRTARPSRPPAGLRFTLTLPEVVFGEAGAEIRCRGKLIREVIRSSPDEMPMFALSIDRYQIVRKKAGKDGGQKTAIQ